MPEMRERLGQVAWRGVMTDDVEAEVAAIVAWLRGHSWECEKHAHRCKADGAFPFVTEFENLAAVHHGVANAIERGDYRTYLEAPEHPDRESDSE